MCFVPKMLQWVVVSSTINFFMGFYIGSSDNKFQPDRVIRSNHSLVCCKFRILSIICIFFIINV